MKKMASKEILTKNIAGEITLSDNPGTVMRKWREIFGVKQCDISKGLGISASVISDYESGRRRSPGINFVKRFINTLISTDIKTGGDLVKKLSSGLEKGAILDIREFLAPINAMDMVNAVEGEVIVGDNLGLIELYGYTVIDSIKAILELSEVDFMSLYGSSEERALIFTKVHLGRSPMIAIKVTHPKPKMVVLHGLMPRNVDKLAVNIARLESIPLIVSKIQSENELVSSLGKIIS